MDIVLVSEADIGMDRSGNRDTVSDLAESIGTGHAAGVEFIELDLGDEREMVEFAGETNCAGLHCNAILSRLRFDDVAIIPLDCGGAWCHGRPGKGQRRVGDRIALGARIVSQGPLWAFSVHFESEGGPDDRAAEAERLVDGLNEVCPNEATVVGGDFNVSALSSEAVTGKRPVAVDEEIHELMFKVLRNAGFEWTACNAAGPTTRRHPRDIGYTPKKIDWMFTRNA